MSTIRAKFDGKVLIPSEPVDLPTDRILTLDIRDAAEPGKGSPAVVLSLIRAHPHVGPEDVDALEKVLADARVPAGRDGVFDDLIGDDQP